MVETLTAAGIKLCLSLGLLNPTYDKCELALMQDQPPADSFMQSPSLLESIPNMSATDPLHEGGGNWLGCINYGIYDTFTDKKDANGHLVMGNDGKTSGGKSWFCWRAGTIVWMPEAGRWRWVFK